MMNPGELNLPFMKCGKVFNPVWPLQLDKSDAPVKLAQVTVDLQSIQQPTCMLIDFSSFVTSILREERFVDLAFALVRTCDGRQRPKVLQVWPFRRTFGNDMNIKEPVVFDFCDCLKSTHRRCTYSMYLIRASVSEQTSYDITNKSINAQVYGS